MPLIIPANTISGGYEVANSLRFNDGSTDFLRRTPSSTGNRRTFTFSTWIKRSALGSINRSIICANIDTTNKTMLRFTNSDELRFVRFTSGGATNQLITNAKFRDVSAWYHIVLAVDTTNSTAGDRLRLYVNGSEITSFSTESQPTQNYDYDINNTEEHNIGLGTDTDTHLFDGYMAEVVLVDGQQLDPTSFGEFDEDSGIWKPIDVSSLTFGTNGFYLDFENSGSLGADVSGNGNNFTVNNLTSIDQTTDTCTNNYATFNSLAKNDAGTVTFSQGNLFTAHTGTDSVYSSYSTIGLTQGKWYAEFKYEATSGGADLIVGVSYNPEELNRIGKFLGYNAASWGYWASLGDKYHSSSHTSYGDSFAVGDIIGLALDLDNLKIYFSKNGTWQNSGDPTSGSTGTGSAFDLDANFTYFMCCNHSTTTTRTTSYSANFGNPPYSISSGNSDGNGYGNFEYAVPSGYYALNTKNLAEYG